MKRLLSSLLNYLISSSFLSLFIVSTVYALPPINVISVDCTPFVSPSPSSFGPTNTMGMSLQQVDTGGLFNVTEVTPAVFRALTAAQLSNYDLIAINNNQSRIDCSSGLGIGTTWQSVVGVNSGGRVVLNSHDVARFKVIIPPFYIFTNPPTAPGVNGVPPFGADELIRQAALWAGGVPGKTGLLIFNDSAGFATVGGLGWGNPALNLPAAWGITDLNQTGGNFTDGGYTDILPAFNSHPIYAGLSDIRFDTNSISSFAANIGDCSFHSVFGTYEPAIFTPTEVVINSSTIDVGGFNAALGYGAYNAPAGPDGSAISLIRNEAEPDNCSPMTQGFWKRICDGTAGDKQMHPATPVGFDTSMCEPLMERGKARKNPCLKAEAQEAALAYNIMYEYLSPDCLVTDYAGNEMYAAHALYMVGEMIDAGECKDAADLADAVNSGYGFCALPLCDSDWTCGDEWNVCGDSGPLERCLCDLDTEGNSFCWEDRLCSDPGIDECTSNSDCQEGWACVTNCCGQVCFPPCGESDSMIAPVSTSAAPISGNTGSSLQ